MKKMLLVFLASVCSMFLASTADATNRLTNPNDNRCYGDTTMTPEECQQNQELAWSNGNGCITFEEYTYARQNFIAPLCKWPFQPREYLGYCRCGCLAQGTEVFVLQDHTLQWQPIDNFSSRDVNNGSMVTLAEQATMRNWDYSTRDLMAMTIGPEEKPLVWVTTQSGLEIGLTETHGVLLANGYMARAVELKAGDVLVNVNGASEAIIGIERKATDSKVYNVLTNAGTSNAPGHIIFANEIAVGDLYWQNILESEFRRIVIRE